MALQIRKEKKSMALQFISGNSISDRTAVMYETICAQACRHPDKKLYISLCRSRQPCRCKESFQPCIQIMCLENIDVVSFGRLAHRLLNEQAGKQAVLLDDTGKSMILRRIAGKEKQSLEVFGRNFKSERFYSRAKISDQ